MFKNLIINKVLKKIPYESYAILQEFEVLVLKKWLDRYQHKIKEYVTYSFEETKGILVLKIFNQKDINIITYKKSLDGIHIKNDIVYIDKELPNPFNYKTF